MAASQGRLEGYVRQRVSSIQHSGEHTVTARGLGCISSRARSIPGRSGRQTGLEGATEWTSARPATSQSLGDCMKNTDFWVPARRSDGN